MTENHDQASGATMLEIAAKIHDARVACAWTQRELAERAGVSRPTVARIERGDDVSTATLAKVAAALDLTVALNATRRSMSRSSDVGGS